MQRSRTLFTPSLPPLQKLPVGEPEGLIYARVLSFCVRYGGPEIKYKTVTGSLKSLHTKHDAAYSGKHAALDPLSNSQALPQS